VKGALSLDQQFSIGQIVYSESITLEGPQYTTDSVIGELLSQDEIDQLLEGDFMDSGRDIVITAYGHDETIDKIAVSTFDSPDGYGYRHNSDAITYCYNINKLELNGNSWIFAKIISQNTQYSLDSFLPFKFDVFLKLDDRAIQKVLREVDSKEFAKALKGEKEAVRERIFPESV